MVTNLILFLLILLGWLEWTEQPERTRRWGLLLAGASLLGSVVMAAISVLFLNNYCLMCIALYALSALTFVAYKGALRDPFFMHLKRDLKEIQSKPLRLLTTFLPIPAMAFVLHLMFLQNYGASGLDAIAKEAMLDWEAAPKHELVVKPSLATGPSRENAAMTVSEFADFRCGHCKHASYSLDAFAKAHPEVRFEFYSFPLDGECNERIPDKSGISCRLAYSVYCAEKEGKGWDLHHALFDAQSQVNETRSSTELDVILAREVTKTGLNWESLQHCIQDPATLDAIKAQAKQGGLVNVRGTPTVLADGRNLNHGQLLQVLAAALERNVKKVR